MQNKFKKVKEALKEAIISGQYSIGAKLPTETEFMSQYYF